MPRRALTTAALAALALLAATVVQAQSVAIRWNQVALLAVAANPPAPTVTNWRLHVLSTAMYDAWAAYHPRPVGYVTGTELKRPGDEHTRANREKAVSFAAFRVLHRIYPNQRALFRQTMRELGYDPPYGSQDLSDPAGVGNVVGQRVLQWRFADGSNGRRGFTQITSATYPQLYTPVNSADPSSSAAPGGGDFDPNRWQPLRVPNGTLLDAAGNPIADDSDPSTFTDQGFLTPHWGAVEPFAMTSGHQFRPPPPPHRGSPAPYVDAVGRLTTNDQAWHEQVDEVVTIQATLTDRQKVIAEFWADGPRTWTPPGHWNQIAQGISLRDRHNVEKDVKMFFALNGALLDAGIAAWEAKRHFDYIRPQSAIRHKYRNQRIDGWAGPDQGTQSIRGFDWMPFQELTFVTPPFSEYVSGHSTYSRSAREVLRAFAGSDRLYDGVTRLDADYDGDGELDMMGEHIAQAGSLRIESLAPAETVVLRWRNLIDAAVEAGQSRLYGGIHFQDGNLRGQEMGRLIGQQAYRYAREFWLGNVPGPQ